MKGVVWQYQTFRKVYIWVFFKLLLQKNYI
nr:MAG TPA: hypothetical protein [Caudoviricetes sp.]